MDEFKKLAEVFYSGYGMLVHSTRMSSTYFDNEPNIYSKNYRFSLVKRDLASRITFKNLVNGREVAVGDLLEQKEVFTKKYRDHQYIWLICHVFELFKDYVEQVSELSIKQGLMAEADFKRNNKKYINVSESKNGSVPGSPLKLVKAILDNSSHVSIYKGINNQHSIFMLLCLAEVIRHKIVHSNGIFLNKHELVRRISVKLDGHVENLNISYFFTETDSGLFLKVSEDDSYHSYMPMLSRYLNISELLTQNMASVVYAIDNEFQTANSAAGTSTHCT